MTRNIVWLMNETFEILRKIKCNTLINILYVNYKI